MSTETTNVIGYFNPNDYPMQIVVAEHNTTLHLNPKKWVTGRDGVSIINDPILDNYVGKGRLARASDKTKTVPVIRLRGVNATTPDGQTPNIYQHPVYSATGFVRDANGQMSAVMATPTAPQPTVPPPVSYNPVRAMSVEQARKLRLIKPTKQVSEDDGIPDTAGLSPIPGDRTPEIKYAVDTIRDAKPAIVVAAPLTGDQASIIERMNTAQTLDPESSDYADKAAAIAVAKAGVQPVRQTAPPPPPSSSPLLEQLTKPHTNAAVPPPFPTTPEPTVMTPAELPEPVLTPEPLPSPATLVVEDDLGKPEIKPAASVAVPKSVPVESPKCPLCPDQDFSSPGYLVRHINRKHPERADALLKQLGLV